MCGILLLVLLLVPVRAGITSNLLDNNVEGDVTAGEEALQKVSGRASFSKAGAVAVPGSYEPVLVDVKWKEIFEVVEVAQHEFGKLLNHSSLTAEDKQRLAKLEMQCLTRADKKVASIKKMVKHPNINKRGFLELLGNMLSLGLGLSNRNMVHDLQGREETLYHNQVENRKIMEKTRKVMAEALEKLQEEDSLLVARESVMGLCHELEQYLEKMLEAVYFAFEGKVTPALLTPEDLEKLAKSVETRMKAQKLRALETGAALLLGADKEVVMTDQMMRIVFLVPVIAAEESVRELWQLNPVELKMDGKLYRVIAHHDFMAVGGGAMTPITTAQLTRCRMVYGVRVCEDIRIAERTAISCITAIYSADTAAMRKLCKFELVELDDRWHATALSSKSFYLKSEAALREKCGDRAKSRVFKGDRAEFVDGQCQLSGAGFDILRLPRPSTGESFTPHVSFDRRRTDSVMEDVDAVVRDQIAELEERLPEVHKLAQVGDNTWIWVVVGLSIAGLVLGFIGAYLLKCSSRILGRIGASAERKALEANGTDKENGLCVNSRVIDIERNGEAPAVDPTPARAQGLVEEGENVLARVLPSIIAAIV